MANHTTPATNPEYETPCHGVKNVSVPPPYDGLHGFDSTGGIMVRIWVGIGGLVLGLVVVTTAADGAINHPVPGIWGAITAAPTCPVERPGQQCAPRGVAATVKAEKRGQTVNSTQSNSAGDYAMALRPGTYTIVVDTGSTLPRCPTKSVTVARFQSVQVNITCDTGIR